MGVNVDRLVVAEANAPTANDWDAYVSLKVKGPDYVKGSTDSQRTMDGPGPPGEAAEGRDRRMPPSCAVRRTGHGRDKHRLSAHHRLKSA